MAIPAGLVLFLLTLLSGSLDDAFGGGTSSESETVVKLPPKLQCTWNTSDSSSDVDIQQPVDDFSYVPSEFLCEWDTSSSSESGENEHDQLYEQCSWDSSSGESDVEIGLSNSDSSTDTIGQFEEQYSEDLDPILAKPTPRKSLDSYLFNEIRPPRARTSKKLNIVGLQKALKDKCKCVLRCMEDLDIAKIKSLRKKFWRNSRSARMADIIATISESYTSGRFRYMKLTSELNHVCSRAYLNILDLNKNTLTRAMAASKRNEVSVHSSKDRRVKDLTLILITWLEDYFRYHGERMPHRRDVVLPYGTRQRAVYDKYKAENLDFVGRSTFYKTWKDHFPLVKAKKTNSFTKCTTCATIERQLARTTSVLSRATYRQLKDEHNERQMLERKYYYSKREASVRCPSRFLSLIIDGMDQAKTNLPHFAGRRAKSINPVDLLKTHVTGVISHGEEAFDTYVGIHTFPQDPNHTINILLKTLLKTAIKNENRLPATLFIQADNCFRENKNRYVLGFCELLVRRNIFLEVHLSFLPVGHTHEDIDGKFSQISEKLRSNDVETLSELLAILPNSDQLSDMFDFKQWILPAMETIEQISRPLHYKFSRIDNGIKLFYKGNHHQEWSTLDSILKLVPNGKPDFLKPDFSKIDTERQLKQIQSIRPLFKRDTAFGEWQQFYQDLKEQPDNQQEWILDILPKQQEQTNIDEGNIIPEVRELLQKETAIPKVLVRKRHNVVQPLPVTSKKRKPDNQKKGTPKQTVLYFYTDYRKSKSIDVKVLQLLVSLLQICLLSVNLVFLDYLFLCMCCIYTLTGWQRRSLMILLQFLLQKLIVSHLQYFAECNIKLMVEL